MTFLEALASTPSHLIVIGGSYACFVFAWLFIATFRNGLSIRAALPSTWNLTLFLILLLSFGIIAEVFWSSCIWGRLYHSTYYVVGYRPFFPITRHELDFEFANRRGALNGLSLTQVNLIWFAVSTVVWTCTMVTYRHLRPSSVRYSCAQRAI
jgi:hypothetical protein